MRLIKLHMGLIKYFRQELKIKRGFRAWIKFCLSLGKAYFIAMLTEYNLMFKYFDKNYRKQKEQHKQYIKVRAELIKAIRLLKYLDKRMVDSGKDRHYRRNFWREFFKDGQVRADAFNDLMKEVGGN